MNVHKCNPRYEKGQKSKFRAQTIATTTTLYAALFMGNVRLKGECRMGVDTRSLVPVNMPTNSNEQQKVNYLHSWDNKV